MSGAVLERAETETELREVVVLDRPELGRRFHPTNLRERTEARALFDRLNRQGYFAYREAPGGGGAEVITTFDETATRITLVPQMIGG